MKVPFKLIAKILVGATILFPVTAVLADSTGSEPAAQTTSQEDPETPETPETPTDPGSTSEDPTDPGTDDPTEDPSDPGTDDPTEDPSDPGTDDPTEDPSDPGTDDPTEDPSDPGTEDPTDPTDPTDPEEPTDPETPEIEKVDPQVTLTFSPTSYTIGSWIQFFRTVNQQTGYDPAIANLSDAVSLDSDDFTVEQWAAVEAAQALLVPYTMPYCINTTINGDPRTRLGFTWETNFAQTEGKVQIVADTGDAPDFESGDVIEIEASCLQSQWMRYSASVNELGIEEHYTDDSGNEQVRVLGTHFNFHKALATGLTRATKYYYRVGTEGAWSPVGSFTTSGDSTSFSFVYATDSQANLDSEFAVTSRTIRKAHEMCPDAQFMLFNGDFCETPANNAEWEWEQWHAPSQDIWMNTRLVTTMGNHDVSIRQNTDDQFRNFERHFNNDTNFFDTYWPDPIYSHKGSVYSFEQGDVLFLVMSFEEIQNNETYLDQIAQWMREQVNASSASWRIACFHQTMFTGSYSHQDDDKSIKMREKLLPVFGELGIHLALQGHDHVYEVIGPVNPETMTVDDDAVSDVQTVATSSTRSNITKKYGGQFNVHDATLYFLNGSCGVKKYIPRYLTAMKYYEGKNGVTDYASLFTGKYGQSDLPSFSEVRITPETIYIDTYNVLDDNSTDLYDSFTVVKDKKVSGADALTTADTISASYSHADKTVTVAGVVADRVFLYSLDGALIAAADGATVDASAAAAGVYLVRADSGAQVYSAKIVIP